MKQADFNVANKDIIAAVVLCEVAVGKTRHLFHPFTFDLIHMHFDGPHRNEIGQAGNVVAENIATDMVGMIMRHQRSSQPHALVLSHLEDARDVPGWINHHANLLFVVAYQIDEVGHLRCKVIRRRKIAARKKLSNV